MTNLRKYEASSLKEWFSEYLADDYADDIVSHGCVGGFPYITYYSDTVQLHDQYEDDIYEMLYSMADEMGMNIPELVGSFNGAKDVGSSDQYKNLLVWFAIEELARIYVDEKDAA